MNLRKDRPTDEQIKDALLSGKTIAGVCKELKTHSQRVMQVKEKYNLECEVIALGYRSGLKSVWRESNKSKPARKVYTKVMSEQLNGWF